MTPRRILLMMGGLFAFGMVYVLYARLFGWLDGLPLLKAEMLQKAGSEFRMPVRATLPTVEALKLAFGNNAPETESAFYPTQLTFRNGDTSLVLASGSPPSRPDSNTITLTPFSVAIFSKPRPRHLMQPGEEDEITTFHSDKAILEFDRKIQTPADMNSAKLVRLQLISDPEVAIPRDEPRQGRVHIVNNQRSVDPNRALVMRTVGPVFYRDPKYAVGPDQLGPDVWTDAPIEIVDRSNIPRTQGVALAAATASEECRSPLAVAAMLGGQRLPPPTVTAVGMRVYLDADDDKSKPAPPKNAQSQQAKKGSAGFSGVRRVELLERVLLHLWVEGGQGSLVGSNSKPGTVTDASPGVSAVVGGLAPGMAAARELMRELLQVETRGPFSYDSEKNLARFDVVPQADPNLPNDVRVTKVPPRPGSQHLLSQVLVIEFNGPPTGNQPGKTPTTKPPGPGPTTTTTTTATTTPPPASGPKFKQLHAWTYTPGRYLTVGSDIDEMTAWGQDLVYDQAEERTTLTGAPLIADQKQNRLTAGGPKNPASLIIEPVPDTAADPKENKEKTKRPNRAIVLGPGRVELFDRVAGAATTFASWQTSMVHTKELFDGRELDLFTLTDAAKFEDMKADYWLKGKTLKLWLASAKTDQQPADPNAPVASKSLPQRIQAIGDVSGHSADMDIEQSDQLIAVFEDIAPPANLAGPVAPMSPVAGPAPTPKGPRDPATPQPNAATPQPVAAAPKEPEKPPKPPMKLRARTIDTIVDRYPLPPPQPGAAAAAAANEQPGGNMKYQLHSAKCDGMVYVHQDPQDPTKPGGTDIRGSRMLIRSAPDGSGSELTVFGWDNRPGEVHNDGTDLIGPKIVIDQPHNLASIEGRGSVKIPAGSGFTGAELKTAEPVVIHFLEGMTFQGSEKTAQFFGKVNASQGASWVTCHKMRVGFDKPIYFTQANRPGAPPKGPAAKDDDKPKLDVVYCYPAPADSADNPLERIVTFLQVDSDPETGRPVRVQKIVTQELNLWAQIRDDDRSEPYRLVRAHGPGVVRTWAPGSKDDDGPAPQQGGPEKSKPAEMEMKLTEVTFTTQMIAKDKGKVYQEATFFDRTESIHVPTDNPDLELKRYQLPPRAVLLTCQTKLVVWTHRPPSGSPQQFLHAYGNALIQNDEYDGWGAVIKSEGKKIIFDGEDTIPARIKTRSGGTEQAGKRIIYDRETRHAKVEEALGGAFSAPAKTTPAPKKR